MSAKQTRPIGLIGYPLEHSFSPQMHNHAFEVLGLNYVYLTLPIVPAQLKNAILGLRAMPFVGANVTIPYKEKIIPYLDGLSQNAQRVGAVNTLYWNEQRKLIGDNTDIAGFQQTLIEFGIDLNGRTATILGAGGAARAVALVLAQNQVKEISFLTRRPEAVESLLRDLKPLFPEIIWDYHLKTNSQFADLLTRSSFLVNATPVGMSPQTEQLPLAEQFISLLPEGARCYDLVYNPVNTQFMKVAKAKGYKVYNGLNMLVYQGAHAFKRWTGQEAPVTEMKVLLESQFTPPKSKLI